MSAHFYEKRLEEDVQKILNQVKDVSKKVEKSLRDAVHALVTGETELAYQTILSDGPINRQSREIDKMCHFFVARHLPSAGHLRFISSVLRISLELERIGDYAVNICRETVQLKKKLTDEIRMLIEHMSQGAFQMLNQAILSFMDQNADLAKGTMVYAKNIDRNLASSFELLNRIGHNEARPVSDLFGLLVIFSALERVSDQAKNICEETVFSVTGERKKKKVYKVLFLDQANNVLGPMASAIASKVFPESGIFESVGSEPAEILRPDFKAFMQNLGYDLKDTEPRDIDLVPEEWEQYHVLASLKGHYSDYINPVPFHCVALNWDVGEIPEEAMDSKQKEQAFKQIYSILLDNIKDLMFLLRGEEAS